jgi:hypothetical protein
MKDVLLIHDNALPHTSLCTCEVVTKMGWTVLPHCAYSPDLAFYQLLPVGPMKDYMDAILQMIVNGKKVFVMCFEVEAGNFTTVIYTVLLSVAESVLKMMETLWKNGLIIAKDVSYPCKFNCFCSYIF